MTKFSDNPSPSLLMAEHVDPSNPASGYQRLFVDTDHVFKMIDSAGTVTVFGAGFSNPMTTAGDIIVGGSSGTPGRLAAGSTSGHVLTSNGSGVAPSYQAAAGGGTSLPVIKQGKFAGTGAVTSLTLDQAGASGGAFILVSNSQTGQISGVTCTNVTWTQVKTLSSAGGFYAIWVGIISGASGTSITWTNAGSFTSVFVYEIGDTLTPTLGNNGSGNTGSHLDIAATTLGHVVVMGGGADNTTVSAAADMNIPAVGHRIGTMFLLIGYATGKRINAESGVAAGGIILAEIT